MENVILTIDGMTCGHCVGQVTKALTQLDGVQVRSVKLGEALIAYDEQEITPADITRAVHEAGYETQQVRRSS